MLVGLEEAPACEQRRRVGEALGLGIMPREIARSAGVEFEELRDRIYASELKAALIDLDQCDIDEQRRVLGDALVWEMDWDELARLSGMSLERIRALLSDDPAQPA
jgi:hypothetical protein